MVDRYTKAVLTVIAVSLAYIAMKPGIPAEAQSGPVRVIIQSVDPYAFQNATVPVKQGYEK